jgi:NAD(P)-dependent dehydrogenase (short-subunit alcohol dehydrogenase family)
MIDESMVAAPNALTPYYPNMNHHPALAASQAIPALIINTGSKQGITTPPGDTAYNVSKAG